MRGLAIVTPVIVEPNMLFTDVPENDYPLHANSTAYAQGDRVIVAVPTHKIYECVLAYVSGAPAVQPYLDTTHWVEVGPTNRWSCLDNKNSSKTAQAGSMYYRITPGQLPSVAYLDGLVDATSVRIHVETWSNVTSSYTTVYDKTTQLRSVPATPSWWQFWFGRRQSRQWVLAMDLPPAPIASIDIWIEGGADLAVGVIQVGQATEFGEGIELGASGGIQDWSRNEENRWGDMVLTKGAFSKRRRWQLLLKNTELDAFEDFMAEIRATPCLFIAKDDMSFTRLWGICSRFEPVINMPKHSLCDLDMKGLI